MTAPSLIPQLPNITSASLTVGEFIGEGGFAAVYRGNWNGREVAIKKLLLKKLPAHLAKDFERETRIMAECSACPQVVKLLAVCTEVGQNAMVMEYMEKGSLFDVLQNEEIDLPWESLRYPIAIDIGKGLSYLHDREILHRDLKSHNILLDRNFGAKITDFGLSKLKIESSSHSKKKKSVGTVRWQAPELLSLNPLYSKASDVYAYGMILWEIASRRLPFASASDAVIISQVEKGAQETLPEDCPQAYGELILKTWNKADKRPSAQYIVLGLEKLKPKPVPNSWHFDPDTKSIADAIGKEYALIEASPKDVEKVARFYLHHPVPGYEIASVKVVYNPTFNRSFEAHLKKLQKRHGNAFFDPKWSMNLLDPRLDWRQKVAKMFEEMAKPYTDPDYPNVKLIPLWHGTSSSAIESICQVGYANPTAIDAGFFGRGLYGAHEAAYPYRVYCKGAFFLNWVAIYSAYPVVIGDKDKLEAKGNFENYDAHFIPVSPRDPQNPHEFNYDPCQPFGQHTYTEVVVFESAACLPRYLVELQATLKKTPVMPGLPKTYTPAQYYNLGVDYANGKGVEKDEAMAVKYYKLAADQGHADAQYNLGVCYEHGRGVKKDEAMAVHYYKLAAEQGHAPAQYGLGLGYGNGRGVKKDEAMAVKYYKFAADQGFANAQYGLGLRYEHGRGVKKDEVMAVKYYKLAADQGHALAQFNLGVCYAKGRGVKKDEAMAVKYYKFAADQGFANAQYGLGVCYAKGTGVQKDVAMAVKYYKLAADQGYASAQYNLGVCYANGKGVEKDETMAVKYYKLAADQGDVDAQYDLGWCYVNGKGALKDEAMAVKYYQLAADQGDADAQYGLGLCYQMGTGIQKDETMAVKYYKLAADQGNVFATTALKRLKS